jgi:SAM-dependent methyltransferase
VIYSFIFVGVIETVTQDDKGIWIVDSAKDISYPDVGNNDSYEIEDGSFWFSHRNKIIAEVIEKHPFNGDFADIGGGNGFQLQNIQDINKENKNILIEPGYNGCLNAKARNIENVYNMTFEAFDFESFNITGVSMFDVVEHIEDDVTFLKNLYKKLRKGTKVYITVPAHSYLWSDVDDYGGHFQRYNCKMVNQLAKDTDFKLIYFSYFFKYLMPISYILRAIPYKLGKRMSNDQIISAETEQHEPKGVVKAIFDFFEKKEINKIKKGAISQGASCIFVLEK